MDIKKEAQHCNADASKNNNILLQQNDNIYDKSTQQADQEIIRKFEPKKQLSLIISSAYNYLGYDKKAINVAECGTFLEYHIYSDKARLNAANFCKDRFCPMCNWRRSLKIYGQVSAIMDRLQEDNYRFLFLTLTAKNVYADDLPNEIDVLQKSWAKLLKQKRFKNVVCGTFKSLEVRKRDELSGYHPHYHVILAVKPTYFKKDYISHAEWCNMWKSCCQLDYIPNVDIRTVKSKCNKGKKSISSVVAEVAKYAVKDSDIIGSDGDIERIANTLKDLMSALNNRRLCSYTGCFKKVRQQLRLDDVENGDLLNVDANDDIREDLEYIVVTYQWKNGVYITE